jgi:two-component system sensor histidine kinase CreC
MLLGALGAFAVATTLGGLAWVRVYDTQLVRQAESELIAQGVALTQVWRAELVRRGADAQTGVLRLEEPARTTDDPELEPLLPGLRASDAVLPAPPQAGPSAHPADPMMAEAGQTVTPMLREVARHTLAGLRIVDPTGVVVASSHPGNVGTSLEGREEVQRALRGAPVSVLRRRDPSGEDVGLASLSRDTALRVVVVLPVVDGQRVWGAVVLVRTPMTVAKAVYGDRWNVAATALVLALVVALVSFGLSAFVLRPVRALVRQTRSIGAGSNAGQVPIAAPVVAELAELSGALASMARQLETRAGYIRDFTRSVSHEFKTPLAAIRGAVELLEDERLSGEQRARLTHNVARDAERLTRLVERLLVLAKADLQPGTVDSTALEPVVSAVRERLGPQVEVQVPLELKVAAPAEALEAVLDHLVENALQHGGAAVKVRVSAARQGASVWLEVADDGPGISVANRARIFEPFFTTARDTGGTGLGLSIAAALVRAFGGTLELLESEKGAHFRASLPGA